MFAPSWLMTGLTVLLCVSFVALGRWQWGRYEIKRELWAQFERGVAQRVELGSRSTTDLPRYTHVRLEGRWLPQRQFLLDNRTHAGHAGYEVLTPFELPDGRLVLVDRGWVPFSGYRDRLPDVASAFADLGFGRDGAMSTSGPRLMAITGRLDELPSAGLAGGRAPPATEGSWPRLTSFPTWTELAAALGADPRLERRLLLLDAAEPRGYLREWRPGGRGPEQNWSYAIQWWSFAAVLAGLYFGLNLRRRGSAQRIEAE
ncbi:MAG: SURF1 family protein [Gammaproteobacteria bacterium]|nr:SURF1 family protein [Gammaproteobacteria bacterium]